MVAYDTLFLCLVRDRHVWLAPDDAPIVSSAQKFNDEAVLTTYGSGAKDLWIAEVSPMITTLKVFVEPLLLRSISMSKKLSSLREPLRHVFLGLVTLPSSLTDAAKYLQEARSQYSSDALYAPVPSNST